jgi:hypothetical protein
VSPSSVEGRSTGDLCHGQTLQETALAPALPNGMQISCRPYEGRAQTNLRFRFAAGDGAAQAEPCSDRPVSLHLRVGPQVTPHSPN